MVNLSIYIIYYILMIVLPSIGYGTLLKKGNIIYKFSIGFFVFIGLFYSLTSLISLFKIKIFFAILYMFILQIIGYILLVMNRHKVDCKVNNWIFGLVYFIIVFTFFSYYTFNIELNDGTFYTSIVNEVQYNNYFGYVDYTTGALTSSINSQYDFSTYNFMWGILLKLQNILTILLFGSSKLNYFWFIWGSFTISCIAIYGLYSELINNFNIKHFFNKVFLLVFPILFLSSQHYSITHSTMGGNLRDIILAYYLYNLYKFIKEENYRDIILSTLLAQSMISTSSSGIFIIVVVDIIVFVYLILKRPINFYKYIGILAIPVAQFALMFYGIIILIPIVLFYLLLYVYHINSEKTKLRMIKISKLLLISLLIVVVILNALLKGNMNHIFPYIYNHSNTDYIVNIFGGSLVDNVIMIIFWGLIVFNLFALKSKKIKFFIISFFVIYNPFTYLTLAKFLTGVVHARLFSILINYFFLFVLVNNILVYIDDLKKPINIVCKCIALLGVLFVTLGTLLVPHSKYMNPSQEYNRLYKVENDVYDVANSLHGNILYNNQDKPTVLSSFLSIKMLVPNIKTILNPYDRFVLPTYVEKNGEEIIYKNFDQYSDPNMIAFKEKNVCEYLYNNVPDYFILDKTYYSIIDGDYFYLSEQMDNCQNYNLLHENDTYRLYGKE